MSESRFSRESSWQKISIDSGNDIYAVQAYHAIWSSIMPWNYNPLRREIRLIHNSDINNSIYRVIIIIDSFEEDINWLISKLRLELKSSNLKFELKKSELEFDLKIILSCGIGIEVEKKNGIGI